MGLLAVAGCGEHIPTVTATQSKSFDSAPTEVKQSWEKALAADKANDYQTAAELLNQLLKANLNDDQKAALTTERQSFGVKLMAAAEKNDPAAVKAIQESEKNNIR